MQTNNFKYCNKISVFAGLCLCMFLSWESKAAVTIDYIYDDLNRLISVARDDGQHNNYAYDEKGNITTINDTDSDNDGLLNVFELKYGLNPFLDDGAASLDSDSDALTNLQEQQYGTDPNKSDTDNDGVSDGLEVTQGRNPTLNEAVILSIITSILLDDSCLDTDGDGLDDCFEEQIGTDPALIDSDGDGLTDYEEVNFDNNPNVYDPYNPVTGTGVDLNANLADTDSDGYSDQDELNAGSDPLSATDVPSGAATGDINGDGQVNAGDAVLAQRHILGLIVLTADQIGRGDLYPSAGGDDLLTISDFILLQQKILADP